MRIRAGFMPVEYRASDGGGVLTGPIVRYDDSASLFAGVRERLLPGAFGDVGKADVYFEIGHQTGRIFGRTGAGAELRDTREALTAEVQVADTSDGRDAVELVKSGILTGWSMEFKPERTAMRSATRVIEKARIVAVALVPDPAYSASQVEARSRQADSRPSLWLYL